MLRQTLTTTVLTAALMLGISSAGHADIIVSYDFNSASGSATTIDAQVTATAVTAGPNVNNSLVFSNNQARITNSDYEETKALAHSTGQYITFSVEANAGKSLDLTDLKYKHSRTDSAPRRLAVFASVDGGAFSEIDDIGNGNSSTLPSFTADLSSSTYDNVQEIAFRFVFYDDNPSPGLARFDDFILNGEVIPEPASLALMGLGGLLMLGRGSFRGRREA